jgi:exportin-1
VLTDRLHKSGFKMHASILQHMFRIVQHGQVTAPLWAKVEGFQPPAGLTNQVSARASLRAPPLATAFSC